MSTRKTNRKLARTAAAAPDAAAPILATVADAAPASAPAPAPAIRTSARFAVAGALLALDAAGRAPALDAAGGRVEWVLINPARRAGLMRAYVGTIMDVSAERRDGVDYQRATVDTGAVLVSVRARTLPGNVGARIYFRAEPVDAVDGGLHMDGGLGIIVETRGVRSLRLATDADRNGVHTY